MRVALISFEYPPAVAVGGIGTYAQQAAVMLMRAGVDLEVFAAGRPGTTTCKASNASVHRVPASNRVEFRESIAQVIVRRHNVKAFDLFESPEIGAEGITVAKALPEIARVVKLHTPTYLVSRSGYDPPSVVERMRFSLGAVRRGRIAFLQRPHYLCEADGEYHFTRTADQVVAPSQAIHSIVGSDWALTEELISDCPYPHAPRKELCDLPPASGTEVIGFLGRLEPRKGILELAQAIPLILSKAPHFAFSLHRAIVAVQVRPYAAVD